SGSHEPRRGPLEQAGRGTGQRDMCERVRGGIRCRRSRRRRGGRGGIRLGVRPVGNGRRVGIVVGEREPLTCGTARSYPCTEIGRPGGDENVRHATEAPGLLFLTALTRGATGTAAAGGLAGLLHPSAAGAAGPNLPVTGR